MSGKSGKSGGRRDGAGRPAQTITIGREFTLRAGEKVLVRSVFNDGVTAGRVATVAIERGLSKWDYTIKLACDDGETIVIGVYK